MTTIDSRQLDLVVEAQEKEVNRLRSLLRRVWSLLDEADELDGPPSWWRKHEELETLVTPVIAEGETNG